MENISFNEFQKLDIRIGTILEAEKIEGTDKLLKLKIDLGSDSAVAGQDIRELVAGIAETYSPEELIGKQIPILTNLEPKTFKGIESKGMILAVDIDNKATLLLPEQKIPNGSKVR